jgi:hypothetical protein
MYRWSVVVALALLVLVGAMGLQSLLAHPALASTSGPVPPDRWFASTSGPVPPDRWLADSTSGPVPPDRWLADSTSGPVPPDRW